MKKGERQRKWRAKPENQEKERLRSQFRWRNDPKVKVRRMVQNAKYRGEIVDEPCTVCGTTKNIEHHHPDYTQPFVYQFICSDCHRALHVELRREQRMEMSRC